MGNKGLGEEHTPCPSQEGSWKVHPHLNLPPSRGKKQGFWGMGGTHPCPLSRGEWGDSPPISIFPRQGGRSKAFGEWEEHTPDPSQEGSGEIHPHLNLPPSRGKKQGLEPKGRSMLRPYNEGKCGLVACEKLKMLLGNC